MFAVRRAVGCFSKSMPSIPLNSNVLDRPFLCLSGTSKQMPVLSSPNASFSCSVYLKNIISKTEGQEASFLSETSKAQSQSPSSQTVGQSKSSEETKAESEPDVLYHKIKIETRCPDPAVLKSYNIFIDTAAKCLNLTTLDDDRSRILKKPYKKRWTVLKSKFVHRKHLVTYEVRTYHHIYCLLRLTGSTADTFLEYIQRNLPEGVSMRVERVRMEKLPEHLLSPPSAES